ncbi:MAG: hypothetical protein JWO38_7937 [Gemmataceae bacterium]|nr:hypothetical protein [Gemmataceae bacterium]
MNPAPVIRGLLDTSVLVDYREGWPGLILFVTAVRQTGQTEFSELSAMTLITRCQDPAELAHLQVFFSLSDLFDYRLDFPKGGRNSQSDSAAGPPDRRRRDHRRHGPRS